MTEPIILKSQIHLKKKKEWFLQLILTWIPTNSPSSQMNLLVCLAESRQSPKPRSRPRLQGFRWWSLNTLDEWNHTPWYMRSGPATGYVRAARVLVWFAAFRTSLLHPIAEKTERLLSESKLVRVCFSVALSAALQKPQENKPQWDSFRRQHQWKKV